MRFVAVPMVLFLCVPVVAMESPNTGQSTNVVDCTQLFDQKICPIIYSSDSLTVNEELNKSVFSQLDAGTTSELKKYAIAMLRWRLSPVFHQVVKTWDAPATIIATDQSSDHLIAVGSDNGMVRLVNELHASRVIHEFQRNNDPITGLVFAQGNKQVVATAYDTGGCVWDTQTHQEAEYFACDQKRLTCFALLKKLSIAACGDADGHLYFYDLRASKKPINTFKIHRGFVRAIAALNDEKNVVSGGDDNTLFLWDLRKLSAISFPFFVHCSSNINAVHGNKEGSLLVSGEESGMITLWDVARHITEERLLPEIKCNNNKVKAVIMAPSGPVIAALRGDELLLWDYEKKVTHSTANLGACSGSVSAQSLAFSGDEKMLFGAHQDLHTLIAPFVFEKIVQKVAEK